MIREGSSESLLLSIKSIDQVLIECKKNMSKTFSMSLLLSLCLLLHVFQAKCSSPLAPALYIFGDSLTDSGNNNNLHTLAKANYKPYGMDFPDGPTGRFTNGKTLVDFLAQFLGLPLVPPYLGLSVDQKFKTITGMNYASGSAGILLETGSAMGVNSALQVQIELFQETVNLYLPKNFKTKDELLQYLSKSIFIVDIGSNDYVNNYLRPAQYTSSHLYSPDQFASLLLKEFKQHLQDLYNLGAKKFLVFNLAPVGCTPAIKIRNNITSGCAEDVNQLVSLYNMDFHSLLQELRTSLHGSTFVEGDMYATINSNRNPSEYGFANGNRCCITSNETNQCLRDGPTCLDSSTHIYWDEFHPTQQANLLLAIECFYSTTPCTPINVLQLAKKQ
ncbi:GDSL esterase/lipase 7-like [Macadamia integrifolia]|uniref:GDSL esterase/lipase 7-like n=1 Tax=Macadamia integrifolia TaxID=60698 RepID=UPI001C4F023C|nr:GDSL esterase/lipase 7-like [Macadamia integrifolia]